MIQVQSVDVAMSGTFATKDVVLPALKNRMLLAVGNGEGSTNISGVSATFNSVTMERIYLEYDSHGSYANAWVWYLAIPDSWTGTKTFAYSSGSFNSTMMIVTGAKALDLIADDDTLVSANLTTVERPITAISGGLVVVSVGLWSTQSGTLSSTNLSTVKSVTNGYFGYMKGVTPTVTPNIVSSPGNGRGVYLAVSFKPKPNRGSVVII